MMGCIPQTDTCGRFVSTHASVSGLMCCPVLRITAACKLAQSTIDLLPIIRMTKIATPQMMHSSGCSNTRPLNPAHNSNHHLFTRTSMPPPRTRLHTTTISNWQSKISMATHTRNNGTDHNGMCGSALHTQTPTYAHPLIKLS